MKKENMLAGTVGLLAGLLIAGLITVLAVNRDNHSMMEMMGIKANHSHQIAQQEQTATNHNEMSMSQMTEQLKNKTGDDFDKAFIEMMITHHEGAVAMAELIPNRAKHEEIKTLGEAIIYAQAKEIANMKQWQQNWGYTSGEMNQMMHGGH